MTKRTRTSHLTTDFRPSTSAAATISRRSSPRRASRATTSPSPIPHGSDRRRSSNAWIAGRADAGREPHRPVEAEDARGDRATPTGSSRARRSRLRAHRACGSSTTSTTRRRSARILASFATRKQLPRIELIAIDRYPRRHAVLSASASSPPPQLADALAASASASTAEQIALGAKVWPALIARQTPEPLEGRDARRARARCRC